MRFQYNFTTLLKIFVWIMFAVSIAVTILALLVVFDAVAVEITHAQGGLLLFSSTLVAVFSLLLGTVHYRVTKTHLRLNLAFFDIFGGKVPLENILNIVIKNEKMYISYLVKGSDPVIAQIVIKKSSFSKMKTALMSANENIVFFDEDEKTKD